MQDEESGAWHKPSGAQAYCEGSPGLLVAGPSYASNEAAINRNAAVVFLPAGVMEP